jgi:aminomethyltransferase
MENLEGFLIDIGEKSPYHRMPAETGYRKKHTHPQEFKNMGDEALARTALYSRHVEMGAKMTPFGGWEMPVQYEGILAEHHAVRRAAGLFDVSHMGRVELLGPDALSFINHITINDVYRLEPYQSQYSAACYEHGGIVDDLLVYRLPDRVLVVLNAGNRAKDMAWMRDHQKGFDVEIRDVSAGTALVALQGPEAERVLGPLTDLALDGLKFQHFVEGAVAGVPSRVFRTGYTGEDGFEIWYPAAQATRIWDALLEAGASAGVRACGLGARDTLRLEAGLCLYGHEIDETTNPLEAGLGWITKLNKPDFTGKAALMAIGEKGLDRKLIGFRMLDRSIPRQGYALVHNGNIVGAAVSGTISPTLGYGIGTGYVPVALAAPGTRIEVDIRGRNIPGEVIRLPFYTAGSRRSGK